jgi:hypothetical protein
MNVEDFQKLKSDFIFRAFITVVVKTDAKCTDPCNDQDNQDHMKSATGNSRAAAQKTGKDDQQIGYKTDKSKNYGCLEYF